VSGSHFLTPAAYPLRDTLAIVTITPDTKDWTWVLHRICPECGFDTQSFAREQIPALVLANAGQWREVLSGPGEVHRRPRPEVWSPLEYACHVRDVHRLYAQRLELMLTRDNPSFPNWDQDVTAVEDRYGEQDPQLVGGELGDAARTVAEGFASVAGEQWERTGNRSDGAHFTVESFGRYYVHDPIHHLYDAIGRPAA
jgi:DinB superfamily